MATELVQVAVGDLKVVRRPDDAGVQVRDVVPRRRMELAPDLAVEVMSPGDTSNEVKEKVTDWLDAGTRAVWVVDPRRRTVSVYRSMTDVTRLAEGDELDGGDVVPAKKPDPAIYRKVIEATGRPPEAHLFIDDIAENVEGARAVGMDAVLHTDSESLWREFMRRGLATEAQRPSHTEVVVAVAPEQAPWGAPDTEPQREISRE